MMTTEEIKQGFLAIDPQHTFFLALLGALEGEVESEAAGVCAPELTDGGRQFNAGRLARARDTLAQIRGTMELALKEEAQRRQKAAVAQMREQERREAE